MTSQDSRAGERGFKAVCAWLGALIRPDFSDGVGRSASGAAAPCRTATPGRYNRLMTSKPAAGRLRAVLRPALTLRDTALGRLAETEQWRFLRHYARLRLDVLRGRRTTERPLGVCFRWRQWQYERNMRRIKERRWIN
jgi:hypothetical protein